MAQTANTINFYDNKPSTFNINDEIYAISSDGYPNQGAIIDIDVMILRGETTDTTHLMIMFKDDEGRLQNVLANYAFTDYARFSDALEHLTMRTPVYALA